MQRIEQNEIKRLLADLALTSGKFGFLLNLILCVYETELSKNYPALIESN